LFGIGGKELTGLIVLRLLSLPMLAIIVFSSLGCLTPVANASSHPRNEAEALNAGFRGIIEPENPVVLQTLHMICPTIDEEHFTTNFLSVYTYSMLVPYAYDFDVYGVNDYWQTSEETISSLCGDCEDQAINLATLIEALYKETYGYIPSNLVWVVTGYVVVLGAEGGHGWVLVNEGLLPRETVEEIKSVSISEAIISILLKGLLDIQDLAVQIRHEIEVNLDLSTLPSKGNQQLSLFYSGERYFELEPTWNLPVSEYYFKKYPYTEVWEIFNSQGYDLSPDFYPTAQPPYMGAMIKNIAFPLKVVVGTNFTVNITVQNYDCGNLGADLVVILKNYGVEVTRKSAYVYKYWWQVQTFVFNLLAIEPAQKEEVSVELFWHNVWWPFIDDWILEDFKNVTMQTIPNEPDLVPYSAFTYPKNASKGQLLVFNILGQNLGPIFADSYAIDIFIDDMPFDRVIVANCSGFSGFHAQTKLWVATIGVHSVKVVVDPMDVISEYNETNNEIVVSFEVVPALHDVAITDMMCLEQHPEPGHDWTVCVTLQNNGLSNETLSVDLSWKTRLRWSREYTMSQNITLLSGDCQILNFTLTPAEYCVYTINAHTSIVDGDFELSDNSLEMSLIVYLLEGPFYLDSGTEYWIFCCGEHPCRIIK
jgi:hypothetical protein